MMVAFEDGVPELGRVCSSLDTLTIDKASRGSRRVLSSELTTITCVRLEI